jgi:hypothetical protein
LLALAFGACASEPPPPAQPAQPAQPVAAPPPPASRPAPDDDDNIHLSGSGVLGSLSDDQMQAPIQQRWPEIERCKKSVKPPWYVGGRLWLKFRVSAQGEVKRLTVEEDTLGSWPIERCILSIARQLVFAHPKGGEAEFSFPIEFPARAAVTEWEPTQISADMMKHKKELTACDKAGARHPFSLTVYLGAGGRITSAGVAYAGEIDEAYVDCVIAKATTWKLTDPLGTVVRSRYEFR